MIYVIALVKDLNNEIVNYRVFEDLSQSFMTLDKESLTCILLNTKIQVVNATIQNKDIIVKSWAHGICIKRSLFSKDPEYSGPQYVVLEKYNDTHKVINCHNGNMHYWSKEDLATKAKLGQVANCKVMGEEGALEIEDTHTPHKDENFEKQIESKYTNFKAKAAMIGNAHMTFDIEIDNKEVIINKYTGSNRNIIIPSFVTVIRKDAFKYAGIHTVDLNEGLKIIGAGAFVSADTGESIERVKIPSTVQLIGSLAFNGNDKLFESRLSRDQCKLNSDRFKLRNSKTVVLKQNMG